MSGSSESPFDWSHGSGVSDASTPRVGARFGAFEIQGTLGRGGMGLVLAARDSLGRDVALKLLNRARPSERAVERFRREGQVMASLRHPGIVAVHEAGLVNGCPFLSCERIDGRDFAAVLEEGASRDVLLGLVREIADAVGYAHQRGVVHRDLKPSNVLVDTAGHAHVTDFGLAQAVGLDRMTLTGALVGTPSFMAPEQITSSRDDFGPHTDTWALGVMLYVVLTGDEPFHGDTLVDLSAAILRGEPRAPRRIDPTIPKSLEAVCLKALRKTPRDRYPDGLAFAADLTRGWSGAQPLASRERKPLRLAAAALVVLTAALVGGGVLTSRSAPEPPEPAPAASPTASEAERGPPADARLQRELERGLAALRGASPTRLRDFARLAPRLRAHPPLHPRLQAARSSLAAELAADAKAGRALPALTGTLHVLSTLGKALPPGRPDFPGAAAAANEVVRACARVMSATPELALDTLEALERWGVRSDDPVASTDLFEAFLNRLSLGRDPDTIRAGKRMLLVCAKLDVGTGGYAARQPHLFRQFGPSGDGPWAAYATARCSREGKHTRRVLLGLLEHPPVGFDLGPVHWAETARHIASSFQLETRLRLLTEAGRRDPRSYLVQTELSSALRKARRWEEALAATQRAHDLFVEHGFVDRIGLRSEWELILARRVRLLVRCGLRARACQAYRDLSVEFPPRDAGNASKTLKEKHPWLLGE